jgi:hypothetical protein
MMSLKKRDDRGKTRGQTATTKPDVPFYFEVSVLARPRKRLKVHTRPHIIANTEKESEEWSRGRVSTWRPEYQS